MSKANDPRSGDRRTLHRALVIFLSLTLVVSIAGVGYVVFFGAHTNEPYTELYLLGADGQAADYPSVLRVGETGNLTAVVENHRTEPMPYVVEVAFGNGTTTTQRIVVPPRGAWRTTISVTPSHPGERALRVRLYRADADTAGDPYRSVRLWIDVRAAAGA